jgi:hypothetical protein
MDGIEGMDGMDGMEGMEGLPTVARRPTDRSRPPDAAFLSRRDARLDGSLPPFDSGVARSSRWTCPGACARGWGLP